MADIVELIGAKQADTVRDIWYLRESEKDSEGNFGLLMISIIFFAYQSFELLDTCGWWDFKRGWSNSSDSVLETIEKQEGKWRFVRSLNSK